MGGTRHNFSKTRGITRASQVPKYGSKLEIFYFQSKKGNYEVYPECNDRHSPNQRQPQAVGQVAHRQVSSPGLRRPSDDCPPSLVMQDVTGQVHVQTWRHCPVHCAVSGQVSVRGIRGSPGTPNPRRSNHSDLGLSDTGPAWRCDNWPAFKWHLHLRADRLFRPWRVLYQRSHQEREQILLLSHRHYRTNPSCLRVRGRG